MILQQVLSQIRTIQSKMSPSFSGAVCYYRKYQLLHIISGSAKTYHMLNIQIRCSDGSGHEFIDQTNQMGGVYIKKHTTI